MSKSTNIFKYILIVSGGLVLCGGLAGLTLPPAQADVIVPLVRKTPTDEVYTLVGQKLAQTMRYYYSIFIVLGVVIVVSSWADLRKFKK